jgi:hypothetical protein
VAFPVRRDAAPEPSAGILVVTNDLVWWIPFAVYLVDAWPNWWRDVRTGSKTDHCASDLP